MFSFVAARALRITEADGLRPPRTPFRASDRHGNRPAGTLTAQLSIGERIKISTLLMEAGVVYNNPAMPRNLVWIKPSNFEGLGCSEFGGSSSLLVHSLAKHLIK